ncbi:MAG: ribonuclease III [Sphingomonadales bacterium]|nr:MAG: ribonuclease III [Sphingomonadales bacterium]
MTRPNSSNTGKRRRNRARGTTAAPSLAPDEREACEAAIAYRFKDPLLLDRAMTHRSASQGKAVAWSNERLEFLGDRVLGLVIVEALLVRFPDLREGELAPRLNALVSRDTCAIIGADLGLGQFLIVDGSERATGGPAKRSLLANAAEAVIGAVYLDGGLKAVEKFILKHWGALLKASHDKPRDAKSALQEWAQGEGLPTPTYRHDAREGPDHAPVFTATVLIEGHGPVHGSGASKQHAERAAAQKMLAAIGVTL